MNEKNDNRFYYNEEFIGSPDARSVRLLSEYYGPLQRFKRNKIQDTIVFFGSARLKSQEDAASALASAPKNLSKKFFIFLGDSQHKKNWRNKIRW